MYCRPGLTVLPSSRQAGGPSGPVGPAGLKQQAGCGGPTPGGTHAQGPPPAQPSLKPYITDGPLMTTLETGRVWVLPIKRLTIQTY